MSEPETETGWSPREAIAGWWTDAREAAASLTRLPLPRPPEVAPEASLAALRAFPLVGAAIGLAGGVVYAVAAWLGLGAWIAALLAVATTAVVTGALHETALAGVVDDLAGRDRPETRALMGARHAGGLGVLALVLSVALRAAALAALAAPAAAAGAAVAALVAAHAAARAALPGVMWWFEAAPEDGPDGIAGPPSENRVVVALVLGAALTLLFLGPVAGFLALVAGAAVAFALGRLAEARLGGYTGGVLGALEQPVEIAVLLVAAAA